LRCSSEINLLPITSHLDEICTALKKSKSHFLVLTAETGAGKSTVMPLGLLENFAGNILMLEPRRLAVINIASRVSDLLGEKVGGTCGYQIALENKTSSKTRFTVLTEAILTKKLQSDPSLEGVSVVVIDEFHERSVHADLDLAFLKESMQLRDDLFVIVMSATIDSEKLSNYLGSKNENGFIEPSPMIHIEGRQFPVEVKYEGNVTATNAVLEELRGANKSGGSILVFLPGIKEIRKTKDELEAEGCNAEILVLHSSVSFEEQRKVLREPAAASCTRVILSSAIAQTSLTVPDVAVVVDSGLSRVNTFNKNTGMEMLVTRNESVFDAEQRKGRAGRVRAGKCIRLWNEYDVRTKEVPPEILRTDLSELVLECAEWGVENSEQLSWLDEPNKDSWNTSVEFFEQLGCLKNKEITNLGKSVLSLGLEIRLACVALSGVPYGKENDSISIALKYSQYANLSFEMQKKFTDDLQKLIAGVRKSLLTEKKALSEYTKSKALLAGFPDRIAVKLNELTEYKNESVYQFPSGRKAKLSKEINPSPKYIIAVDVNSGDFSGTIYSYEEVPEKEAEDFLFANATSKTEATFVEGTQKLQKTEYLAYGKIVLKTKKIQPEPDDYKEAVCSEIEQKGIDWLPLDNSSQNLLLRVQFYIQQKICMGTDSPVENLCKKDDNSMQYKYLHLQTTSKEWLLPFLSDSSKNITSTTVYNALFWYLEGEIVNKFVPSEYKLPNGKVRKLGYENNNGKIRPTIEVIIQQIFGCFETPKVCGVPILFKLLSPARRPLQITDDLENFWKSTWPEICKEMKGRYPKHNWDYRISTDE